MGSGLRRPLTACAVLLAAYVALSLFNDTRGYLGTDTGGKVATLRTMERHRSLVPEVGYWAERWDPDGRLHPLAFGGKFGDRYVNVSTLPMLYAAYPLYRVGGYRAALLLPMLGAVAAALAARALARRLTNDDRVAWWAFWIVGLASPLTVYALDFWEHTAGVALLMWAAVVLIDAVDRGRPAWWAIIAGLLIGVAATMRTEAFIYGLLVTGVSGAVLLLRRHVGRALVLGIAVAIGVGLPLLLNDALERHELGSSLRSTRAQGTVQSAVGPTTTGSGEPSRAREAGVTSLALQPDTTNVVLVEGVVVALSLGVIAWRAVRRRSPALPVIAAAGVAFFVGERLVDGPGFIPGMVAAAPLVVVALVRAWRVPRAAALVTVALLALPLVWRFQFVGASVPQWAGRYMLPGTLLLVVVGVVQLVDLDAWARRGFVGLSVVVTSFGLVWLSMRSHDVARSTAALQRRPEPVLVSTVGHLFREAGGFYGDRRWLTITTPAARPFAAEVLSRAGVEKFGLITLAGGGTRPSFQGYRPAGSTTIHYIDEFSLRVTTYVRA